MSFCEQLQKRRKELGLSRTELAARLGVSPSAVGNYETGVSAPKEEVLLRLFDALEVDPNYLYRGSFRHIGGIQSDEERKLLEKYRRLPLSGRQTVHTLVDALDIMVAEEQRLRPRQERRTIPLYQSPAAAGFAAQLDPTLDELGDIKTAVSEAVTNAIVHAYPDQLGKVVMKLKILKGGMLEITIRDWGRGIENVEQARRPMYTTGGSERSGMGFTIMESFTDRLVVRSVPGKGTTVQMRKRIAPRLAVR